MEIRAAVLRPAALVRGGSFDPFYGNPTLRRVGPFTVEANYPPHYKPFADLGFRAAR